MVKEQTCQYNRKERIETDSHKYSQLTFDRGAKAIQWRKFTLSSNDARTTEQSNIKKKERERN